VSGSFIGCFPIICSALFLRSFVVKLSPMSAEQENLSGQKVLGFRAMLSGPALRKTIS
jgi:hypothetical protein